MLDKILQPEVKRLSDTGSEVVQQQRKSSFLLDTIIPHKGHKFWELNVKTLEFDEIAPSERVCDIDGRISSKIIFKDGHLYCSALNRANAEKKFIRMLNTVVRPN